MGKRVLVVDDEKLIVKGIRFSLEQDGMEVTCAYDGEEALEQARNSEFDMILLDIMLPCLLYTSPDAGNRQIHGGFCHECAEKGEYQQGIPHCLYQE